LIILLIFLLTFFSGIKSEIEKKEMRENHSFSVRKCHIPYSFYIICQLFTQTGEKLYNGKEEHKEIRFERKEEQVTEGGGELCGRMK